MKGARKKKEGDTFGKEEEKYLWKRESKTHI